MKLKVTAKQDKFCRRYLIDFNATKAAIEIGFSKKTARFQASRLLTKVNVRKHLDKLIEEEIGELDMSRQRLLQELGSIAYVNMQNIVNKDHTIKPIHSLNEEDAAAISTIEVDEIFDIVNGKKKITGVTKKVKTWDKLRALEMIAKLKGYGSTVKITGTDDKGNLVKEFKVTLNL